MTEDSRLDDMLFERVGLEMARKEYFPGPMARAVSDANGEKQKIEGLYIRYRFQELKNQVENEIQNETEEELERVQREKRDFEFRQNEKRLEEQRVKRKRTFRRTGYVMVAVGIMAISAGSDAFGLLLIISAVILIICNIRFS
jgi:hypothetical protein